MDIKIPDHVAEFDELLANQKVSEIGDALKNSVENHVRIAALQKRRIEKRDGSKRDIIYLRDIANDVLGVVQPTQYKNNYFYGKQLLAGCYLALRYCTISDSMTTLDDSLKIPSARLMLPLNKILIAEIEPYYKSNKNPAYGIFYKNKGAEDPYVKVSNEIYRI